MWRLVYNTVFTLCLPLLALLGVSSKKIRKNFFERLFPAPAGQSLDGALWIHAASIGEAVIAENLLRFMQKNTQVQKYLVTTNTYYTEDLLRKRLGDTIPVHALPFDTFFSMKRFLGKAHPLGLIIVETEIWPNLIWLTSKGGTAILIVNGRISDNTFRNYRRFSFFMRSVLRQIDMVLAQSQPQADRFVGIGMNPSRVLSTGNIKYYRLLTNSDNSAIDKRIVTYGSIKEKELEYVYESVRAIKAAFPDFMVFIAPRELHLSSIIEKDLSPSFSMVRYSIYKSNPTVRADVVIVDTVGDLPAIYAESTVAFVGGSLAPYGGQNMLEPLFFGTPVLFGPFVENFKDIADEILRKGAGMMVKNASELTLCISTLINDASMRGRMGTSGREIIAEQEMVMARTVNLVMASLIPGHGAFHAGHKAGL